MRPNHTRRCCPAVGARRLAAVRSPRIATMLTHEQTQTAYALLAQADAAFDAGDKVLGSRRLWDAFAEAIGAVARQRRLPCRDDDDIRRILKGLAAPELEYLTLLGWFSTARRFREAAASGDPEDYVVEIFRPEMPRIIAGIANLG